MERQINCHSNLNIEFDIFLHEYRINDEVWPSVSNILEAAGIIDTRWFKEGARNRGIEVHEDLQMIDDGMVSEDDFKDDPYYGYLLAYGAFKEESGIKLSAVEQIVVNEDYRYCGTLDRVGEINSETWIIDIKTGNKYYYHGAQLAAYYLASGLDKARLATVNITVEGKYKLHEWNLSDNLDKWLSALNLYNWKNSNEKD